MTKEEHIEYWLTTAQHDMESASSMLDSKHFDWSLFVGHLALEKLLKAHWVNIEPRYPEQKLAFYKLCTKEFAGEKLTKIKEYYEWLRRMI